MTFFWKRIWPWMSLLWGIYSGISMNREFSQSLKISIFSGLVLLVAMLLPLFNWLEKYYLSKFDLSKGRLRLEWLADRSLQTWSQTILLFSLPMLVVADAWLAAFMTMLLSMITLWDPWFDRILAHSSGRAIFRTWSGLLTVSFLYGVFFPSFVGQFYANLGFLALAFSFPWWNLLSRKFDLLAFTPFLMCLVLMIGGHYGATSFRFPLVCIWLKKPGFLRKESIPTRLLLTQIPPAQTLASEGLCFISPIIAPRKIKTKIIHEWYVDGSLVDQIYLEDIEVKIDNASFHTWSCKLNMPAVYKGIRVKVLLPDGAVIGEKQLKI